MKVAIFVLNHNGLRHVARCFASLAAVTDNGRKHDVVIVDNASTDGSDEYVRQHFPWVHIYRAPRNAYLFAYNDAVAASQADVIGILDNDTEVAAEFVEPLLEHMRQPDVFAAGTRILLGDRQTSQGARSSGRYERGLWWYEQLADVDYPTTTFFAPNQCFYDRRKFMELGGFDSLLWPIYHEDIDLAYRAWRRGWRIIYEPRSVVYHHGGQTRKAEGAHWHRTVVTQNTLLFQWKNIDDRRMRAEHVAWMGPRILRAVAQRDGAWLKGYYSALTRWRAMRKKRAAQAPLRLVPDRDAFARIMAGINGNLGAAIA